MSSRFCVVVRFPVLNLTCASVYCDINECATNAFQGVSREVNIANDMVICADTNAHNYAWGSLGSRKTRIRSYSRGDQLLDLFDELNVYVCNIIPHQPTYVGGRGCMTHIDVTLCTTNTMRKIARWEVCKECFESDHRVIDLDICIKGERKWEVSTISKGAPWKKPSTKKMNEMNKTLIKRVKFKRRVGREEDMDLFIQRHTNEIREALGDIFATKSRPQPPPCYWWTPEVRNRHRIMKLARRRMVRYRYENLVQEYNQCRSSFRKAVREAKICAWREFMSQIDDPWKGLMRILDYTKCNKHQSRTLCSIDGEYATDRASTLRLLAEQFYPPQMKFLNIHRDIEQQVEQQLLEADEVEPITKSEFRTALSLMSKATAPGEDGVTNNVLHILASKCKFEAQYINMYDVCLKKAVFPNVWKQANIVLIPKAYDLLNSVKSLRPISLISVFSKLLERIVLARILHYIELSGKLSLSQHAYRKGGSTTTALYEVAKFAQDAIHDKQICIIVFLDISGAFDRTWHGGILYRLLQYGVPKYLVKWVRTFLSNRSAIFREGGDTHKVKLDQGCPQGGVLSPVLWNVLFNDMLVIQTKASQLFHLKTVGYADDAAVLCRSNTVANASVILTKHLQKIKQWATENRVQMNKTKLHVMTINRRFVKTPASVFYDGVCINEVAQYKYLGLIFDSRMTWKPHVNKVLEKLAAVTRMLRGAVRESWGIRMGIMRMIFKTVFCPILLYGAVIWGWKVSGTVACMRFDRVIRKFCIMATRCFRSTSNDVLFRLMRTYASKDLIRLEVTKVMALQLNLINDEGYMRNKTAMINRQVPASMEHYFHICRQGINTQDRDIEYENLLHYNNVHPTKWFNNDIFVKGKIQAIWDCARKEGWVVCTDASVSSYAAGWAFSAFHNGFCLSVQGSALSRCTIFNAEAQAIRFAVRYIMSIPNLKVNEVVEIRSDAQAVLMALHKTVIVDPVLRLVKVELGVAKEKGRNIVLRWVPGHMGNEGNEMTDAVARSAVDSRVVTRTQKVKRDLKTNIREVMNVRSNNKWEGNTSVVPKLFFPCVSDFEKFLHASPSVELCQLVTGHCRLNYFMSRKMGVTGSPLCECNEAEETVMHYLVECSLYDQIRKELWEDPHPPLGTITKEWMKVDLFIQRTKRFDKEKHSQASTA